MSDNRQITVRKTAGLAPLVQQVDNANTYRQNNNNSMLDDIKKTLWAAADKLRAKLRLMVKRILRKYKYPPDKQESAIELVLQQAKVMGQTWA